MRQTFALSFKELNSYFSSILAFIFLAVFVGGSLAVFFYVENFWSRGIADIRPLFRWLPVLLIFLTAALTMRQWSEEESAGTLEMLMILPVRLSGLVLAKFMAVLTLIGFALILTLFLPLSLSFIGDVDYGPVVGGYVAALLLAAMYASIGLFISSRTNNQLVALIVTVLVCGAFYMVGAPVVTDLFSDRDTTDMLRNLSSGSRFDSIERGVLDARDLAYYFSITAFFLGLNVFSLDARRWGSGRATVGHRLNMMLGVALLAANAFFVNVWLFPLNNARLDLTEDKLYTLSDVTIDTLQSLNEPLTIRVYISEENLPQAEPLIPQLEDTLNEYEIKSNGNVEVIFIDPLKDEAAEQEANNVYGITPRTAQFRERTDDVVRNIYFDVLFLYGDQYDALNITDIWEVDEFGDDVEIRFRNLEYDLTSTIRSVVSSFQSTDVVLASFDDPATLTLYYSGQNLPDGIDEAFTNIEAVAAELGADGNLTYELVDMDDPATTLTPSDLFDTYGLEPVNDFFTGQSFYFHVVLIADGQAAVINPTGDVSASYYRGAIDNILKRFSTGFLTVVGVYTPTRPQIDPTGTTQLIPTQFYADIQSILLDTYDVRAVDLAVGAVPADIDVLMVINPQLLTPPALYAIDQYLMQGGTVFISTGPFEFVTNQQGTTLEMGPVTSNLDPLLEHYGVDIGATVVLDPQFVPSYTFDQRGLPVQLDLPQFIDIRQDGMSDTSFITSGLEALAVSLAAPITLGDTTGLEVDQLLVSSDQAWASLTTTLYPPASGNFFVDGEVGQYLLGVALTGSFTSYYADNEPPQSAIVNPVLQSPDDAKLVIVSSAEFFSSVPAVILLEDRFEYTGLFAQNMVDWSQQDTDLLAIRSRSGSLRLLDPLSDDERSEWEVVNFAVAGVALMIIAGMWRVIRRTELPMTLTLSPEAESIYVLEEEYYDDDDDDHDDDDDDDDDDRYDDDDDDDD